MQTRALAGSLTPALLSALLLAPQPAPQPAPLHASPGSPRAPHPRRPRPTPPPAPLSPQALTRQRGRARPRTRRPPRMHPRSRPRGVATPRQASPCGRVAPFRALAAAAAGGGRQRLAETSPRSRCARELEERASKRALRRGDRPHRGLESCLGSGNRGVLGREVRPTRRHPATLSMRRGPRARGMRRGRRVRALMCRVLLSHRQYCAHDPAE